MTEKDLILVNETAECLHSAAIIAGPEGTKAYGLPTDVEKCLDCGWRAFEQACGKQGELPPVQIVWWPTPEFSEESWVAECFSWEPAPGESGIIGRGKTPGAAMHQLAKAITSSPKGQRQ